jgi:hypothetical protein
MLNLTSKRLCLVLHFIGHEEDVIIVEGYDKRSLYPMLIKCHHHLPLMPLFEIGCANPMVDEDSNMDFLKQINNTNEPMKDLVNKVNTYYKGATLGKKMYSFLDIFWYILGEIFL